MAKARDIGVAIVKGLIPVFLMVGHLFWFYHYDSSFKVYFFVVQECGAIYSRPRIIRT